MLHNFQKDRGDQLAAPRKQTGWCHPCILAWSHGRMVASSQLRGCQHPRSDRPSSGQSEMRFRRDIVRNRMLPDRPELRGPVNVQFASMRQYLSSEAHKQSYDIIISVWPDECSPTIGQRIASVVFVASSWLVCLFGFSNEQVMIP